MVDCLVWDQIHDIHLDFYVNLWYNIPIEIKFIGVRSMKIEVKCGYCGHMFLQEAKRVNHNASIGNKNYCSKECHGLSKTRSNSYSCICCGKEVLRTPGQMHKNKSDRVFCTRSCATRFNNSYYKKAENNPNYVGGLSDYRERALLYYGPKCSVCGYDIESVLEVHHRDGNRENNEIENLDVLCPTHHKEYGLSIKKY